LLPQRAARFTATHALGFPEVNAAWREVLKDEHLRTVSQWRALPDRQVGVHLAGVAALQSWWDVVGRACPLVASPVAERVLCEVRLHFTRLLATCPAALPSQAEERLLGLARALAAQAQRSEHAYAFGVEELSWARQLRDGGASTSSGAAEALLQAFPEPASGKGRQGAVPEDDEHAVKRFYERHVFPRWEDLAPWEQPEQLAAPLRAGGAAGKSVLVAGCGTGRWACHFAASFPGASVLGVDVSEASVRFALERKRRFALRNLEFEAADLRGWRPERRFDLIECGGVLHHLEDPEAAWARLVSLLRPDGVMLVSLYSRMGRWPLKALREDLMPSVLPGWTPGAGAPILDDEALRRFRQALLARTWTSELLQLARSPDLHSLARLRDTFFHPLEHEYTWLEVQQMLDRLGLRSLGLDADPDLLGLFHKAMPGRDPADLSAWHELEVRMPELFIGMYELFVAKKQ